MVALQKPGPAYVHNPAASLLVLLDGTPITEFPRDQVAVETVVVDAVGETARGMFGCYAPIRKAAPRYRVRLTVAALGVSDGTIARLVAVAASRTTAHTLQVFYGDVASSAARLALANAVTASGAAGIGSNATGLFVSGYGVLVTAPDRSVSASEAPLVTWEFEGQFPTFAVGSFVPARVLTADEIELLASQGVV